MLRKLLLVATLGVATSLALPAAAAETIGSADAGGCYPFACNDGGPSMDYYEIYSASAFSGPLTFDTITFFSYLPDIFGDAQILNGSYDISFATTSDPVGGAYPVSLSHVGSFFVGTLGGANLSITGNAYAYDPGDGNLVMHVLVSGQETNPDLFVGYMDADYTVADASIAFQNGSETFAGEGALVTEFSTAAVPEPAAWGLMLIGFGAVGSLLRANRRRVVLTA